MKNNNNIKKILIIFSLIYIQYSIFFSDIYYFQRPKVSIFLPIYNKELYLENCIKSLRKQTLKDIQIIAVNDGSTDNSLTILKKLSKQDERIKIINNDRNHGLLYARAMGILNSTGEYLMNLDPDDKLLRGNDLENLYKTSNITKSDIVIYLIKRIAVNKSDINNFKYLDNNQLKLMDDHITNKLVKKDIFIKAYNEYKNEIFGGIWNFHEDNIWSYLVRKNSNSITILNKYIYSYKRNKDSLNMQMGNEIDFKNRFYRYKKFIEMNYKNSIEFSLKHSLYDANNYYNYTYKREIKTKIIRVLMNLLELYSKRIIIYKSINLVLNMISKNKIIIFYKTLEKKLAYHLCLLNLFKSSNLIKKSIISVNVSDIYNIEHIKNFIYSSDIIILLDNLINKNQIKTLLDEFKNNEIIALINTKTENYKQIITKKFHIYFCKYG